MLIPVRCFTCGNVTGDKWSAFVETVIEEKNKKKNKVSSELDIEYMLDMYSS